MRKSQGIISTEKKEVKRGEEGGEAIGWIRLKLQT